MDKYDVTFPVMLLLGKQGENRARQIPFDLSGWMGRFGPGTVRLLHQRNGDEAPYPVAVEQEGDLAVWTVTNADTAAAGSGRAELQYYVDGTLVKTANWTTKVLEALGPSTDTPPEAQQGWVDQVLQAGAAAAEAAQKAEDAAIHQPIVGSNGNWWTWDLNAGAYADTGIYSGGGSGGEAPHIGENGNWYVGQTDTGVSATGPAGQDGAPGAPGPAGKDGSPGADGKDGSDGQAATFEIVSTETLEPGQDAFVTEVEGSTAQARKYSVAIPQGEAGPAGADGATGPQGPQGETGPQGPTGPQGEKGDTGETGATGPQGPQGETGAAGADGYTPVKGTDYWTADDQQAIVDAVLAALPAAEGVSV